MNRRGDPIRRSLSAAIVLLTLGLSVAVPVMERGTLVGETAVESHHDPSRCAHAHDHRVCTQVGANLSLASAKTGHRLPHLLVRATAPAAAETTPSRSTREGPPPRAPPLA
jgi:hypothetical protein